MCAVRLGFPLLLLAVLVGACGTETGDGLTVIDADLVARAEALLETDQPWSAARLLADADPAGLDPSARLVAARAEAGRGGWSRVLTLLADADSLGARGRYLRARAYDEAGRLDAALAGYDAFLADADSATFDVERGAARLRRALVRARTDGDNRALAAVSDVPLRWRPVLLAEALARDGDTARVEALAARVSGGAPARRMWSARIDAARQAGDLAAARGLADRARAQATTDDARADAALAAGETAAAIGDAADARALYRAAIRAAPGSRAARRAAAHLRDADPVAADWLALARTDRALGLNGDAADAFLRWLAADTGTATQRADVRFDAADALFDAQRYDEVEAVLAPIRDERRARDLWAGTLSRMGRTDDAAEAYLALTESDPAPNLYFAADALHQGGDTERALALYARVEREHAGTRWAGLATMRRAGQAFLDGDHATAAALWDGYRGNTHALRARYWAGRAHAEAGDAATAQARFRGVRRADRDSYYALLASEALGEPFWPLPMSASPAADAGAAVRVALAFRRIDVLREAGFPEIAEVEVDGVVAGLGRGQAVRYALAEALIERGYGLRAIRIGQSLGGGTNERRLRILYPFPFRRMIASEAEANGVGPFVAAALIRQESQFSARATSHVGARGLMQLMPATARTLAAEADIEDWDPDLLYLPEVNVHLGARYVGQQAEAYDGALPAIFGAYNAGPHQVEAWRAFPEFGRDALFAERIPFRETRDYVKILTRNRAIYEGLYGMEEE